MAVPRIVCVALGIVIVVLSVNGQTQGTDQKSTQPAYGSAFDEVVVESSLTVKKKDGNRQSRTNSGGAVDSELLKRIKRQFGRRRQGGFNNGGYNGGFGGNNGYGNSGSNANSYAQGFQTPYGGSSASAANANAQGFQINPNGFGGSASAAQAAAQGFQTNGPFGGFGASAANAGSQGFSFGPNGVSGNAGLSGSQAYNLPGGHAVNIAYSNGFNVGADGRPSVSNGNSISYTK